MVTVRVIGFRHQRTLAKSVRLEGVGLVTGARVRLRFLPAPTNTGVVFRRIDQPTSLPIPAVVASVTGTQRRTTLGPLQQCVTLVEHLLAALAGLRVDNCLVELDGPEPPGLDGSAAGYVAAIRGAGVVLQHSRRPILAVTVPVLASSGGATIGLYPGNDSQLRVSYLLDYGTFGVIPRQVFTLDVTPGEFVRQIANCRTFVTEAEASALRAQGIGQHLTPADLIVFGPSGPIANRLRFADEPARHKVLDLIGDLSLCGFDLAGHLVAYRSGHALNVELACRLVAQATLQARHSDQRPFVNRAA